jgi:hypothetical protein
VTKRSLTVTVPRVYPWIDLLLILLLAGFGTWISIGNPWGIDPTSAAALSGALYGGAALLLGNWINRVSEWRRSADEAALRVEKLKALIAPELIDLALQLMSIKKLMDAAVISINAGGVVSNMLDLPRYRLRPLSLAESLGSDLLVLYSETVDALTALRTNLAITRQTMDSIALGENFGLLRATELSAGLADDMGVLSRAIELICPARKLTFPGGSPTLVTEVLKRAATRTDRRLPT